MINKSKVTTLMLTGAALVASEVANAEVSANVALTTDYVWRGISQNQEDPALQGGFDYEHESGFYAGVWGSNVNFGDASTEIDLYAGWSTELDSGLGIDIGVIEYTYHGSDLADANDFTEAYIGLSYGGFSATYSAGDEFNDHFDIGYGHDFESFSLSLTYGNYDDYAYFMVGASTSFGNLDWSLDYIDADSDADVLFGDDADGRLVLTVSKSF